MTVSKDKLKIKKEVACNYLTWKMNFKYDGIITQKEAMTLQNVEYPIAGYGFFNFTINVSKKITTWQCAASCE